MRRRWGEGQGVRVCVCWTVKHLQATEAAGREVRRQAERECMNHVTVYKAPKTAQETPTSTNATVPFYPSQFLAHSLALSPPERCRLEPSAAHKVALEAPRQHQACEVALVVTLVRRLLTDVLLPRPAGSGGGRQHVTRGAHLGEFAHRGRGQGHCKGQGEGL